MQGVVLAALLVSVVLTSVVMGVLTSLVHMVPTLVNIAVFITIFGVCLLIGAALAPFTREPRDKDEG